MMNTKNKTSFQLLTGVIFFAAVAVIGCNSGSEKTEIKTDSVTTEKSMEVAPAPMDTTMKMHTDTAKTRPTPGGS